MVAFAAPDPYASSSSQEDGRSERILSAEELFFVKKAKQEHQQTTEAAKRALQVGCRLLGLQLGAGLSSLPAAPSQANHQSVVGCTFS